MSANGFVVAARWVKEFVRFVRKWWATMAGWLSIPFVFLALFDFFSKRFLFAALAFVALWVQVIAQYRRLAALTRFKLTVLPGYHIGSDDPNSVIVELSLLNDSTPPAELHNVAGQFWTDERFISRASTRPTMRIPAKKGPAVFVYYTL
jgi:hypothetical protein